GHDVARNCPAMDRPCDQRGNYAGTTARQRLFDTQHGEPESHIQTRTLDHGESGFRVLASGSHRTVNDAESRYRRLETETYRVREERFAGAIARQGIAPSGRAEERIGVSETTAAGQGVSSSFKKMQKEQWRELKEIFERVCDLDFASAQ